LNEGKKEMSNELSKPSSDAQVPAFLEQDRTLGTELLNEYVRPPRLKIVQAMSREPFDQYNAGAVLIVPHMIVFADYNKVEKRGEPWRFVPLFFYPEWVQTNPMDLIGKAPFVRARSLDPTSELARKARDRETWMEPHPDNPELQVANREHLNFVVMPYEHELAGTMCVMTFSKANFKDGANLAAMIKMRRAPIFGQVFDASVAPRKNQKGNWFGLDVRIPTENPWIKAEEVDVFKPLHLELAETHKAGLLQVDYDDVPTDETHTATSDEY
jgi:hypothetical protein